MEEAKEAQINSFQAKSSSVCADKQRQHPQTPQLGQTRVRVGDREELPAPGCVALHPKARPRASGSLGHQQGQREPQAAAMGKGLSCSGTLTLRMAAERGDWQLCPAQNRSQLGQSRGAAWCDCPGRLAQGAGPPTFLEPCQCSGRALGAGPSRQPRLPDVPLHGPSCPALSHSRAPGPGWARQEIGEEKQVRPFPSSLFMLLEPGQAEPGRTQTGLAPLRRLWLSAVTPLHLAGCARGWSWQPWAACQQARGVAWSLWPCPSTLMPPNLPCTEQITQCLGPPCPIPPPGRECEHSPALLSPLSAPRQPLESRPSGHVGGCTADCQAKARVMALWTPMQGIQQGEGTRLCRAAGDAAGRADLLFPIRGCGEAVRGFPSLIHQPPAWSPHPVAWSHTHTCATDHNSSFIGSQHPWTASPQPAPPNTETLHVGGLAKGPAGFTQHGPAEPLAQAAPTPPWSSWPRS